MRLFSQIQTGETFYYHDKPERELIKSGRHFRLNPEGKFLKTHPHVLVFQKKSKPNGGTKGLA